MITKEDFIVIHSLYAKGHSISEIARLTKLNRRTVRRRLKDTELKPAARAVNKVSKLEPFKPYILDLISKSNYRIPASVILKDIKDLGYLGGRTILCDFLNQLYKEREVISDPVVRFETEPGQQVQVDWTTIRYGRDPIYAFVATLGYSRYTFVKFTNNMEDETLIQCHEQAFLYFGGVPKTILYDNMKSVVIERNTYGPGLHKYNNKLLDLSKKYQFAIKLCKPYRAKTKGKVERFNSYLKGNFYRPLLAKLRDVNLAITYQLLNEQVSSWLITANERLHGTTNRRPIDLLNEEVIYFTPLLNRSTASVKVKTKPQFIPETIVQKSSLAAYDDLLKSGAVL